MYDSLINHPNLNGVFRYLSINLLKKIFLVFNNLEGNFKLNAIPVKKANYQIVLICLRKNSNNMIYCDILTAILEI